MSLRGYATGTRFRRCGRSSEPPGFGSILSRICRRSLRALTCGATIASIAARSCTGFDGTFSVRFRTGSRQSGPVGEPETASDRAGRSGNWISTPAAQEARRQVAGFRSVGSALQPGAAKQRQQNHVSTALLDRIKRGSLGPCRQRWRWFWKWRRDPTSLRA
jgi:hypothetical protein